MVVTSGCTPSSPLPHRLSQLERAFVCLVRHGGSPVPRCWGRGAGILPVVQHLGRHIQHPLTGRQQLPGQQVAAAAVVAAVTPGLGVLFKLAVATR